MQANKMFKKDETRIHDLQNVLKQIIFILWLKIASFMSSKFNSRCRIILLSVDSSVLDSFFFFQDIFIIKTGQKSIILAIQNISTVVDFIFNR